MHVWNEVRDTRFELYRVHCSVSEYLRQNLNAGDAQAGYGYLLNGGSHVLSSDGEHWRVRLDWVDRTWSDVLVVMAPRNNRLDG